MKRPHLRRLDKEELIDKLLEENKELKIKVEKVEADFIEFGQHEADCDISLTDILVETTGRPCRCTCGFDKALKGK